MAKTTAIRAPTTDPVNHQIVLRQLKEASETASRLRGNARDSFAQVGELLDAGIVRFVDGKLVAPSPSSLPPTVVPSTRQIKTGGSIQGGGSLAADLSLELVGDAGSPGNSMLYGTNATGVKGWYTQPAAATTLASLADVSISGLTNGQVLAYNSTASKWENQAAGGGSLSSLTDVLLTSPSNGQSLVYNSTAGKWENQTISTGGGSGGTSISTGNWTPDSHPANPDPTNDEFEASSLSAQWSWTNKGAAQAKLNQGYAYFIGDSATPYSFIGQVTPGSSWKYRAKMMFEVGYVSYAFGGISIWNASSGKSYIFGPSQAVNGRAVYSFTSQAGAGYSQVGSDTSYGGPTAFVYYEIQCDGTSLYFRVSESGEDDSFHQVYTATLASFIGSVDHIGIAVNQYVTPVGMIVDWFRRVDTGVTPSTGGGSNSTAVPGTIPDLAFWWESDNILGSSGGPVVALQDRTPWIGIGAPSGSAGCATLTTNALNSLPAINFGTGGAYYSIPGAGVLKTVTIFTVFNCSVPAGPCSIIGSQGGSGIILRVWSNHLSVLTDLVGGGGSATATVTANTWYQGNVTFNSVTGDWAFRQARAASGSGTNAAAASAPMSKIGSGASGENYQGQIAAVIVYSRVLTSTEISSVENYLNAKWGV